jgi:hypothetical protein
MNLITRIISALGWPAPAVQIPTRRRLRATCEYCGKSIAVIGSTGRLWAHHCAHPDYGPAPGPMDPHDRIDELERTDD